MISPRAVAVQGVGFTPRLVAVQGLAPATGPGIPGTGTAWVRLKARRRRC